MPRRKIPLVEGEMYHVINRGINRQAVHRTKRDYGRLLETLYFYQWDHGVSLSRYLRLSVLDRMAVEAKRSQSSRLVRIHAYCLMPNHYHLLLKQEQPNGIRTFAANFQNSYTKYFGLRHDYDGPLFKPRFRSIYVRDEHHAVSAVQYVHKNPLDAHLVSAEDLPNYRWSSLYEYCQGVDVGVADLSLAKTFSWSVGEHLRGLADFDGSGYLAAHPDLQTD